MKRLVGGILLLTLVSAPTAFGRVDRHERIGGPDPATVEWPEWPHEVSCDRGLPFDPVVAFSGPTNAERGSLPSEKALQRFLAKNILSWVRKRSWRLVVERDGAAEFASGRLSRELEWMRFRRVHGRWKWESYSSNCKPSSLRRGVSAISWELAQSRPPLSPSTRSIEVNLGPGECNDGRSQNERLQRPEFREQQGKLVMTLWLRPVSPGFHNCVGIIEPPLTIELPEPLGDRELVDGGTYPPRRSDEPIYGP
jgi:hypothetical protein